VGINSTQKQMSDLLTLAKQVLICFVSNGNTGNCYEIFTYLEDLRTMGITNERLDQLQNLLERILQANGKPQAAQKIRNAIPLIKERPVGNGLFLLGKKVVYLKNVTQDDGYGDTADKIYVFEDGTEMGESIEGGKPFDKLEKCISNPTCKRYGCEQLIPQFKRIAEQAVIDYKAEMTAKYGADEEGWPSRVKTDAATDACNKVALLTAATFNALPEDERKQRMSDILRCEEGKLTADFLRMVDKDCKKSTLYRLTQKNIDRCNPTLTVNGVFLEMFLDTKKIGQTQVKFNNGVYHKGKTSSIYTSWNATAYLSCLFDLTPIS
jgi:hypothetical protein